MLVHFRTLLALASAAAALAVGLAAPAHSRAATTDSGPRACFFPRQISSWREAGEGAVVLRITGGRYYRLDLASPCPELRSSLSIGLDNRGTGSVCVGEQLGLVVRDISGQGSRRCPVADMVAITPEEGKAALSRR